ncbi:bifunctional phosphoglucose/phosphomannose isomerase [Candidatus Kuenenbacteria bacterium]|nr:bifunctional phosphoglucose/phosphomannose isomerase [Candidatus Kuenenbacteria bacterium]
MQALREQFDKSNLYEVISNIPKQFTEAFGEVEIKINPDTSKILFCGMGGSALPANLLKTFLSVSKSAFNIPIKINRDYNLPHNVDSSWCGFFDSYSGNTEETLEALKQAEDKGLKQIVILAHTGKLEEIAKEKGYLFIRIPDTSQPRMGFGYVIGAMLKVFANSGLLKLNFDELNSDIEKCLTASAQTQEQAHKLADTIKGKIPVVYTSNVWKYVAMVWKINFNENAKTQSFWNAFPELNHNEMVGYTNLVGDYKVIVLKDTDEHPRIQKRMDIFEQILGDKLNVEIIEMNSGSVFYKLTNTLMLGAWTAYYLALLNEVDPTPVDMVEEFKKKMKG